MLENFHSLSAIEEQLEKEISKIEGGLISEIPLTDQDFALLKQTIRNYASADLDRSLEERFPVALSCFLVRMGVESYRGGNYWEPVEGALNRNGPQWQKRWGETFLGILERYRLVIFNFQGARKYVAQILAHGGIPDHCLPDFFKNLVLPIIDGSFDADWEQTRELIAEWKTRKGLYETTDKPVRRFLEEGGKPAADFLGRSIEMARVAYDGEPIPPAQELGLPQRIVDQFERWWHGEQKRDHSESSNRFRRPKILFSDYCCEVCCILPEQRITREKVSDPPSFQVVADRQPLLNIEVPYQIGSAIVRTEAAEFFLPPAKDYAIKLTCGSQILREWNYVIRDEVIAFDDAKGLIPNAELPRDPFWLAIPKEAVLDPAIRVLERRQGAGEWADYHFCFLDPYQAESLSFTIDDVERKLPLQQQRSVRLCEEPLRNCIADELPIYSMAPTVQIPLSSAEEIQRWEIIVKNLSASQIKRIRLCDIAEVNETGRHVTVKLTNPHLTLDQPAGKFWVKAQGPLGRDKEFKFALIQDLEYEFDRVIYLAEDEAHVTLILSPVVSLSCEDEGLNASGGNGTFEFKVPPHRSRINLRVKHAGCEFPISIVVPRLQWRIRSRGKRITCDWSSKTQEVELEKFESDELDLIIQAPLADKYQAMLQLEGIDHKQTTTFYSARARFEMQEFRDSVRALAKPAARFFLLLPDLPPVCPLQITTCWTVENFDCAQEREGSRRRLLLSWTDKGQVKNRLLRLWDVWRIWKEPRTFSIEDGASELEIDEEIMELPAGLYRAEFYVEDEYSPSDPSYFVPPAGGMAFDMKLGDEQELADSINGFTEDSVLGYLGKALAQRQVPSSQEIFDFDPEEALTLIRALAFLIQQKEISLARRIWLELSSCEHIVERVKQYVRQAIHCSARRIAGKAKLLLLEVCKICRLVDESLIPFKIGDRVRFEGKVAQFQGIKQNIGEDLISLRYAEIATCCMTLERERLIPLNRLDEIDHVDDDSPLSKI